MRLLQPRPDQSIYMYYQTCLCLCCMGPQFRGDPQAHSLLWDEMWRSDFNKWSLLFFLSPKEQPVQDAYEMIIQYEWWKWHWHLEDGCFLFQPYRFSSDSSESNRISVYSYKPAPLVHSSCNVCCTKNHCLGLLVSVKDGVSKKYLGLMLWCNVYLKGKLGAAFVWLDGRLAADRSLPAIEIGSCDPKLLSCDSADAHSVIFFEDMGCFAWVVVSMTNSLN